MGTLLKNWKPPCPLPMTRRQQRRDELRRKLEAVGLLFRAGTIAARKRRTWTMEEVLRREG